MKGTHYTEQDAGVDGTGHCGHVMAQDLHYTGRDTAEDGDIKWSNPLKRDKREGDDGGMRESGRGRKNLQREGWNRRVAALRESLSLKVMMMS